MQYYCYINMIKVTIHLICITPFIHDRQLNLLYNKDITTPDVSRTVKTSIDNQ